ncbi:serine hydrolase domain-containing protein [Phreatobacter sp.]|uniref:serine hydrolase domain-containing protein n=1 Tax=Phreatobacter sp. TaxID=1966341 RepID=UPI003F6F631F
MHDTTTLPDWLDAALAYVPRWIDFQVQHADQPGCSIAIAHRGEVVLEEAFGVANLVTGEPLSPRHRFRAASHSKTFTAVGILKLKERGLLRLDDAAGSFVQGLHPEAASVTLGQLLSHSAGLTRDGRDSGQFASRRSFLSAEEVRAELAEPPPIPSGSRFKYSNHGYALLGMVIEAVTGETYHDWITREVVAAAGLTETVSDTAWLTEGTLASGHSTRLPLGRRLVFPGDNPTNGVAAAAGFTTTAADLARFFAQLSPAAETVLLSPASRRDLSRRHWRDQETPVERYYGLGTISGTVAGWDYFGHSGSFQGTLSRTAVLPGQDLTVSVLVNAIDGPAHTWVDGIVHILKTHAAGGAPSSQAAEWAGRRWMLWNAVDFVPVGDKVLAMNPAVLPPFFETFEIALDGPDSGVIARAPGFASPGEPARLVRDAGGDITAVTLGGTTFIDEASFAEELIATYEA